jgi:hypothetical protein
MSTAMSLIPLSQNSVLSLTLLSYWPCFHMHLAVYQPLMVNATISGCNRINSDCLFVYNQTIIQRPFAGWTIGKRWRINAGIADGLLKTSVVHPKLFFPDPDPTLTLISDPDPACL